MPQPYDYGNSLARNSVLSEAMGFADLYSKIDQRRAGEQQQQQKQQFTQDLQGVDPNDMQGLAGLARQYPQQTKNIQDYSKFQNDQQKASVNQASSEMLRAAMTEDPALINQAIDKNANIVSSTGDPSMSPEVIKRIANEDPEMFRNMMAGAYQTSGGNVNDLLSAGQEEVTPITPYQQELVKGANADRELRKLEIEDKKLDREFDRAKDDQAKLLVQEKIDAANVKKTELLAAKEKKKQEAITSTRQTLESVDALLNSPGLASAVGGTSMLPTIAGGEAANFETLLDSFVGNLTLENMSKMSGVLSDSDIKMIQSASSGLSVKMSEKAFKQRLEKIRGRLQEKLAGQGSSPKVGTGQGDAPIGGGNYSNLWGG